jgi:hypothetical protein
VLLRALRDFNLGKLTADDEGIFLGLLNDLFPKTAEQVPRAIDHAFEAKVLLHHCVDDSSIPLIALLSNPSIERESPAMNLKTSATQPDCCVPLTGRL